MFTWLGAFQDNPVILTALVWYMVILVTMVYGPIAALLVELFPARIRYSSMSLPYHIGNGVFGGGVPFIATFLATLVPGVPLIGLLYPMTVAGLGEREFDVQIIPFTFSETTFNRLRPKDRVNLECDMIGKYVVRALELGKTGDELRTKN